MYQFRKLETGLSLVRVSIPLITHSAPTSCVISEGPSYLRLCRSYTTPPSKRPNFFSQFVENVKQELAKNQEMKENLKKFREEAEKLEHSDALKKARQKYQTVESEASRGSEVFKDKLGHIKGKVSEVLEEASKSDIAKKAGHIKEELGKTARGAAEAISEKGTKLGKTGAFQSLSQTAEAVKKELDNTSVHATVYAAPKKLRKRVEAAADSKEFKPNEHAFGVELHKDSRFSQSWQQFKDNNQYVNKLLDWKMRYDESDNPMVKASRFFTDRVSSAVGGLFQKTELSETLTEICKLDPNFDKNEFLSLCEKEIIPNILESMIRGDLEILKDWCHEAPFNALATPIRQAKAAGYVFCSKVIDIDNVDLAMGKVMDQGPVLVISFTTQQIMCLKDSRTNKVIEGDPDKILRVSYVWVLCRDRSELNPRAAWRLLDLSANSSELLL